MVENNRFYETLEELYGSDQVNDAAKRWKTAADKFTTLYGHEPSYVISSPGRTEVCGNHCDHQRGCVIAAAVNTDILAFASPTDDWTAHIYSEGYGKIEVDLNDLSVQKKETGTSAAMVRGIAAAFREYWITVKGFNAYMTTNVPVGSGISSSAAFENAVANIFAAVGERTLDPQDIAKIGQYAENKYYGKPSGLMDQMAAACGGLIYLDFEKEDYPKAERINCDFSDFGYSVCIVHTGKSHSDLTQDYSSVPAEMKKVASFFGKRVLREVDENKFYDRLPRARAFAGDRAVLRAMHYYSECRRVEECRTALMERNMDDFLKVIRESGNSSWKYLQNIYSSGAKKDQSIALALGISEKLLAERGACRVHGGGFAGTIQAFVPNDLTGVYKKTLEEIFGKNSCRILHIRDRGGCYIHM